MERCEPERRPGIWEFCLSSGIGLAYLQHDNAEHVAGNAIVSIAATTCQDKGIINSSEFPLFFFFFFLLTANRLWRIIAVLLHAPRETASIKSQNGSIYS